MFVFLHKAKDPREKQVDRHTHTEIITVLFNFIVTEEASEICHRVIGMVGKKPCSDHHLHITKYRRFGQEKDRGEREGRGEERQTDETGPGDGWIERKIF